MNHRALDAAHAAAGRYLDGLADRPVGPTAERAAELVEQIADALDRGPLPDEGRDPVAVVEQLVAAADPGLVASPGPRYFGFVMGGSVGASMAADTLAVTWDQVAGMQVMSPAAAAAEEVAGAWLIELLGLPQDVSFGFTTGAQMANFTGLAAARQALLMREGWDVSKQGLQGAPRLRVVAGAESHPTVYLALSYLGLAGPDVAAADDQGRMLPDALDEILSAGSGPAIVCAQAGNVNSGSSDPFGEIADVCARHGAWLHVDGAFGLWAAAAPSLRDQVAGVERADSWATDCHKWLNVPYDSAAVFCRDPQAHATAMMWSTAYVAPGAGREPYCYVPEASRRARGFAVWAALRELGRSGVADMIERCCANARFFADLLAAEPGITILNDVVLDQVVLDLGDAATADATVAAVQEDGTCWIGATEWRGRRGARLSLSNHATTREDVERSAEAILRCYRQARAGRERAGVSS